MKPGMARTKRTGPEIPAGNQVVRQNPGGQKAAGKKPATYVSRQVEIGANQSSSSSEDTSKKRRRKIKEKEGQGRIKRPRTDDVSGKKCSPNSIIEVVSDGVSNERRAILKKLGLGVVFELQMRRFDKPLLNWLVNKFNADKMSIIMDDGTALPFTVDDVHRVYGLPRGKRTVTTFDWDRCKELRDELHGMEGEDPDWHKLWTLKKILPTIKDDKLWVRLFVMFCFGYLFKPSTKNVAESSVLAYLKDDEFNEFAEYN
ncbi:unnamed protein product [Linum trigynum]|uniref:Uncharacterized protein n=1 Tax=Linum trigynum TaxID=586398 RepID=A0AAV2EG96_9ROSI